MCDETWDASNVVLPTQEEIRQQLMDLPLPPLQTETFAITTPFPSHVIPLEYFVLEAEGSGIDAETREFLENLLRQQEVKT